MCMYMDLRGLNQIKWNGMDNMDLKLFLSLNIWATLLLTLFFSQSRLFLSVVLVVFFPFMLVVCRTFVYRVCC